MIDIIEITDLHGEIVFRNGYPTASALYNKIKEITDANPDGSIVIGGGDLFDYPPVSLALKGVPARKVLERIGMKVTALGNHECGWSLETINNETFKNASMSILACNLFYTATEKLVYEPYKIFDKKGIRIAVIGAASDSIVNHFILKDEMPSIYTVTDAVDEVNKLAEQIRNNNKADIIIVIAHDGVGKQEEGQFKGDLIKIAKGLKGIDAIYGGHDHKIAVTEVNGLPLLDGGQFGQGFIHTQISISGNGMKPEIRSEYIKIDTGGDPDSVVLDEEIEKIIRQANEDTGNAFNEILGYADEKFENQQMGSHFESSLIGNWVCNVMRDKTGADAAICTNNHIKPILKGRISPNTLFYVTKKNTLCTITVTLSDLKKILEEAFRDEDKDSNLVKGQGIQAAGIKIKYNIDRPSMDRIVEITREDGSAIGQDEALVVAVNGFIVRINRELFELEKFKLMSTETFIWEHLVESFRENRGIKADKDQRVINVMGVH